jgi:anti-sigma-K factor RskA
MTDMNNERGRLSRMFAEDIAVDLASGRALELAEVYALDAVTDAERAEIEQYISSAPEAEREAFGERVRQARETLARSFTAEEEPPAGLFQRIAAQLPQQDGGRQSLPEERSVSGQNAPTAGTAAGAADGASDELSAARERREQRRRPGGMRNWLLAAAAAAAIALGGVGVGTYVANQNDPLNQVLQAQDMRQATVDVDGGGTATVSVSTSRDAAVVQMKDVPAPPEGKVYQMWLIPKDGSEPVSQGLMDAEALAKPAVVKGISSAASLGITVEPLGGSEAPTTPVVAAARLST